MFDFCCRLVVNGFNLYEYSEWRRDTVVDWNVEGKMLTVAVQLTEASCVSLSSVAVTGLQSTF